MHGGWITLTRSRQRHLIFLNPGSRGDSFDITLAESVIGLYRRWSSPSRACRSFEQLELATARWADLYNHRGLHSSIGERPPAEFEWTYHREHAAVA